MKFILGKKQNMSQFFTEDGKCIPVTILSVPPSEVIKIKEVDTDGYRAVQIGFDKTKETKVNKAQSQTPFKIIKEVRLSDKQDIVLEPGDKIDVSQFEIGDKLAVSSVSKGKGFQGVVKRHGFKGGRRSHGQKHSEREPGSIGGGLRTRVPKGMRMAGRMGGDRITQKNLRVVSVNKEQNLLLVKGAVAGRKGTLVEIVSK